MLTKTHERWYTAMQPTTEVKTVKASQSVLMSLLTFTVACDGDPKVSGAPPSLGGAGADDTGTTDDTGNPPVDELTVCEKLGLPAVDFNLSPHRFQRHGPTGDFRSPWSTELWTLSENWSGCESYIFLTHNLSVDEADGRTWWANGIDGLFEKSPPNAHYFFIVAGSTDDHAGFTDPLADDIATQLARLDEDDQSWWSDRIHVVAGNSMDLSGFIKKDSRATLAGWASLSIASRSSALGFNGRGRRDSALDWPWGVASTMRGTSRSTGRGRASGPPRRGGRDRGGPLRRSPASTKTVCSAFPRTSGTSTPSRSMW